MKQLIELNQKEIDNISGGFGMRGVVGGVFGVGATLVSDGMDTPLFILAIVAYACARVVEGHGPMGEFLFPQDEKSN